MQHGLVHHEPQLCSWAVRAELHFGGQGTAGMPGMPGSQLAAALGTRQLFVYCGHGG